MAGPQLVAPREATRSVGARLAAYSPAYAERYHTLRETFGPLAEHIAGKTILDFGCGKGMSAAVLVEFGARQVTGVDIFPDMMAGGEAILRECGYGDEVTLRAVEDTRRLPFLAERFDTVVCNAVFEHIPQPRGRYLREAWRMVKPGGVCIINETPNKYLPFDFHTLHLPLTNWLPSRVAHRVGVTSGRFDAARSDWAYSGWRGMGYYEMLSALRDEDVTVEHEVSRPRHRLLRAFGLPGGLLDPYPLYVLRKGSDRGVPSGPPTLGHGEGHCVAVVLELMLDEHGAGARSRP